MGTGSGPFRVKRDWVYAGRQVPVLGVSEEFWRAEIIVTIALHDQADRLPACLDSVWLQEVGRGRLGVLILDDASTDGWMEAAGDRLDHPALGLLNLTCGSAARSRNALLDYVDTVLPTVRWVARLDADDRFTAPDSLPAACKLGDQQGSRFVLGGNRLTEADQLLPRTNPATAALRRPCHVLGILRGMAEGTGENELPSCNLVMRRGVGFRYPEVTSGEDHWLVSELLIRHGADGAILESPFYCDYNLNGVATKTNCQRGNYRQSRRRLLAEAERWARSHGVVS